VVAHTVCHKCADQGMDVVQLALLHQVSVHGLREEALAAKPLVFWPWKIQRRPDHGRERPAPRVLALT